MPRNATEPASREGAVKKSASIPPETAPKSAPRRRKTRPASHNKGGPETRAKSFPLVPPA